jgi:hypothetical protein
MRLRQPRYKLELNQEFTFMARSAISIAIIMVLLAVFGCRDAHSSNRPMSVGDNGIWVTGTLGVGTASPHLEGLSDHFGLNVSTNENQFLAIRTAEVVEFDIFGNSDPLPGNRDFGVLYGVRTSGKRLGFVSFAAGLSYVRIVRHGQYLGSDGGWFGTSFYQSKISKTVGLPLEAQAVFKPFSPFGLGLLLYGNVNPVSSFWGVGVSLSVGRMN